MIYQANELLAKLNNLQIWGQNKDKDIEWFGTNEQWEKSNIEAELILKEFKNEF